MVSPGHSSLRGTPGTTTAPLSVRVPMGSPHGEAPTLATPLGTLLVTNRDTWEWGGRPLLPYSTLWSLRQAPLCWTSMGLPRHTLFWKTTRPLGALAAAAVPKAPTASDGHISLVQAFFLSSDHSIGIYSSRRCRWTPHLLHLSK